MESCRSVFLAILYSVMTRRSRCVVASGPGQLALVRAAHIGLLFVSEINIKKKGPPRMVTNGDPSRRHRVSGGRVVGGHGVNQAHPLAFLLLLSQHDIYWHFTCDDEVRPLHWTLYAAAVSLVGSETAVDSSTYALQGPRKGSSFFARTAFFFAVAHAIWRRLSQETRAQYERSMRRSLS